MLPTERFSTRVENYIKYRPTYPPAVVELLEAECGLTESSVVADIGSGTGILAEMFLRRGYGVYGVEPNREMREAGERLLAGYERFTSVAATAEETTLADACVDLITAGQAFHWFDPARARREFARVLRPGGWTAVVWNVRLTDSTPFLVAYEQLLVDFGTDYKDVGQPFDADAVRDFYAPGGFEHSNFHHQQIFDFEALRGRLLSASYVPEPSHPKHRPMLARLREIFDAHQRGGDVAFDYETRVFYGRL
ncbi:MAG TPA: class I SAM-dependent methyltransferase [Pyrinomonadaceae bacterium]|nr:class I SAM-dependent methyltransferase [Pyrinomonadaceae bacterium]